MMSTGMEAIRERMADYLNSQGVTAVIAWPRGERTALTKPVVVVSVRRCQGESIGFQDYLGERYDEETGLWEELYGKNVTITFGLDLYASGREEGTELQEAFHALAQALTKGGPQGLTIQEFSCGETVYDQTVRLCRRPAQAVCLACLRAVDRGDGIFTEFELRGGLQQ